jgi:hypothetical protein
MKVPEIKLLKLTLPRTLPKALPRKMPPKGERALWRERY